MDLVTANCTNLFLTTLMWIQVAILFEEASKNMFTANFQANSCRVIDVCSSAHRLFIHGVIFCWYSCNCLSNCLFVVKSKASYRSQTQVCQLWQLVSSQSEWAPWAQQGQVIYQLLLGVTIMPAIHNGKEWYGLGLNKMLRKLPDGARDKSYEPWMKHLSYAMNLNQRH